MYYYIFDQFLNTPEYEKEAEAVTAKVNELDVAGETARVTSLRKIPELAQEGYQRGHQTIVVVGNDASFHQALNICANSDVCLGFIPVTYSVVATALNLPSAEAACREIAARRVQASGLARVNDQYFLSTVEIGFRNKLLALDMFPGSNWSRRVISKAIKNYRLPEVIINLDGRYIVQAESPNVTITNIALQNIKDFSGTRPKELTVTVLERDLLKKMAGEKFIRTDFTTLPDQTHLKGSKIRVETMNKKKAYADGCPLGTDSLELEPAAGEVKLIVGREKAAEVS